MNEKNNWFSHVEWVVTIITLLGGFYLLDAKIERQMERCDKLYEIWCTNVKEMSEMRAASDQKFYDLLKEKNNACNRS